MITLKKGATPSHLQNSIQFCQRDEMRLKEELRNIAVQYC